MLPSPSTNQFNAANSSSTLSSTVAASASIANNEKNNNCNMSGYLQKWTNYINGYQKRWFSLNNGLLSYYRSPNEMEHTCRGTINLADATISSEDLCHFVVSNGSVQTFHLKAANEVDKQKWISALELAKNKAKQFSSSSSGSVFNNNNMNPQQDSDEDDPSLEAEKHEMENMLRVLEHKLNELTLSHEFVLKHSNMLTKSLNELESIQAKPDESTIKTINERSTVYKIAMRGVVNHCQEFINLAQMQTKKMHKILQSERDMRLKLEEMVQEMAKQNLSIETQLIKRSKRNGIGRGSINNSNSIVKQQKTAAQGNSNNSSGNNNNNEIKIEKEEETVDGRKQINQNNNVRSAIGNDIQVENNDDDDNEDNLLNDDEFHDAVEDVTQFSVTLPRQKAHLMHHRNPSNISKLYLQESESDEEEQQTIKVTMHNANKETDSKTQPTQNNNSNNSNAKLAQNQAVVAVKNNFANNKKPSANDLESFRGLQLTVKLRRREIKPRPNYSLNLWAIMKNCIGKDLSKIPIPVNFSEPLSMLQRITEELEYSNLLDVASQSDDQWEQMAYVAAFTISSYSTTATRTNKPFNPLLGETYECDRLDDYGWRSLAEQVSHHPPGFATYVESLKDWIYYQEFTMSSKFRGQYLQVIPLGTSHLEFKKSGNHYTWRKVATFVRNIIVGKLWIDNVGEMDIVNHKTKDVCHLKYFPYSYFSREPPRKVTGIITDSNNVARYVLNGTWTEKIEGAPVLNPQIVTEQTQLNTGKSKILWERKYPPTYLETMYNFTELAVQLNEPEANVAPTDTRLRPDQRLMEDGNWDEANKEKLRLEEKQRNVRKKKEMEYQAQSQPSIYAQTINSTNDTIDDDMSNNTSQLNQTPQHAHEHEAAWFKKTIDPFTKQHIHVYNNEYWECKAKQDWKRCPDIY